MDNTFKVILDKLNMQGKHRLIEGATEEQITAFENQNGVRLPNGYRMWLRVSDGGEFFLPGGAQLHGVAHKPIINVRDYDTPSDNYIVIGALATGDPILCEKNSERISIYNHDNGTIEHDETFSDFTSFLNNLYTLLYK